MSFPICDYGQYVASQCLIVVDDALRHHNCREVNLIDLIKQVLTLGNYVLLGTRPSSILGTSLTDNDNRYFLSIIL